MKKKDAVSFISNILKTISKTEFNEIYDSIDENITSSGLKLKINKQKMIQGKVMLEKKDAVKINISCPIYVKKDSKKIYRQILEL